MSEKHLLFLLVFVVIGLLLLLMIAPAITPTSESPTPTTNSYTGEPSRIKYFESYEELLSLINNYLEEKNLLRAIGIQEVIPTIVSSPLVPVYRKEVLSQKVYSETNVQVRGVDEPDIVKTNGDIIAIAGSDAVYIVDPVNDTILSYIVSNETTVAGATPSLFLTKDRLIVILEPRMYRIMEPYPEAMGRGNTTIYIYDISNPEEPGLLDKLMVTGFVVGARLINNTVYIVTRLDITEPVLPAINGEPLPLSNIVMLGNKPDHYILVTAIDIEKIAYNSYAYILTPTSWMYVSHNKIYLASHIFPSYYEALETGLLTIAKYLPSSIRYRVLEEIEEGELLKAFETVREYLSSIGNEADTVIENARKELSQKHFTPITVFYVFSINGLNISFTGLFGVEGRVLDQFAMEEMGQYFIVATTTSNYTISVEYRIYSVVGDTGSSKVIECRGNTCVTRTVSIATSIDDKEQREVFLDIWIRRSGVESNNLFVIDLTRMEIRGSIRGLAANERIYAARLVGNTFYLVTFRRIDPLFAIDLSNPANPRVIGFIESPGFSEYLHPVSDDLLIGIGRENSYLKISLYDVSDPPRIEEASKLLIENGWSTIFHDHHAFTLDPMHTRFYIPVTIGWTHQGIAVISYTNNSLKLEKVINHPNALRTLYVGDKLYTISYSEAKVHQIDTLEYLKTIELRH
ncbi:MAG: beta-propeller domain-containing protein [Thermoprotei archaeon]